ncbi:hypothetical protein ACQ4M4_27155 [Leptolyngbya sp. AN02str]
MLSRLIAIAHDHAIAHAICGLGIKMQPTRQSKEQYYTARLLSEKMQ